MKFVVGCEAELGSVGERKEGRAVLYLGPNVRENEAAGVWEERWVDGGGGCVEGGRRRVCEEGGERRGEGKESRQDR